MPFCRKRQLLIKILLLLFLRQLVFWLCNVWAASLFSVRSHRKHPRLWEHYISWLYQARDKVWMHETNTRFLIWQTRLTDSIHPSNENKFCSSDLGWNCCGLFLWKRTLIFSTWKHSYYLCGGTTEPLAADLTCHWQSVYLAARILKTSSLTLFSKRLPHRNEQWTLRYPCCRQPAPHVHLSQTELCTCCQDMAHMHQRKRLRRNTMNLLITSKSPPSGLLWMLRSTLKKCDEASGQRQTWLLREWTPLVQIYSLPKMFCVQYLGSSAFFFNSTPNWLQFLKTFSCAIHHSLGFILNNSSRSFLIMRSITCN